MAMPSSKVKQPGDATHNTSDEYSVRGGFIDDQNAHYNHSLYSTVIAKRASQCDDQM